MRSISLCVLLCLVVLCAIKVGAQLNGRAAAAEACSEDKCKGNGCYCSQAKSPIALADTPQMITLVYGDAVTDIMYRNYLEPMLNGRKNPDGAQIGATFYVPHEYTDYEKVNMLYNMGMDIAVHSITKSSLSSYWQEADVETLVKEFDGQRKIIARFANIPIEDIVGARIPNLEMAGNTMFEAYLRSGIVYDNSWVAHSKEIFFPYTLDYLSSQSCSIGKCPSESFSGVWEIPIVDFLDDNGMECNSIQGCHVGGSASEVSAWLMKQFTRVYGENRAPITLTINSGWLAASPNNLAGLGMFMDALKQYSDVFLVSHRQVMDWMKNPVPVSQFKTDSYTKTASCSVKTCRGLKEDVEERYMTCCTNCPAKYPWVGNPSGE